MPPLGEQSPCVSDSVDKVLLAFACASGPGSAEWCEQMCWERSVSACWDTRFLLQESIHPLHSDNHREWERAKSRCMVHLGELKFMTPS